ncbi:MAG: hypothetical protein ACRDL6_01800 [Solirubrobacterales bacterium]
MSRRPPFLLCVAALASAVAACGGDGDGASGEELFGGEGLQRAVGAVGEQAGEDASLLRIQVTDRGAEFYRLGERTQGLIYADGELTETEFQVIGAGALSEQAFPLSEVEPEAIDRLLDGAEDSSGEEVDPVAVTLERSPLDGELRWTLNAQGGIVFSAGPDGSDPAPAPAAPQRGF